MTDQDKFTDHDPLIGEVNFQLTNGQMVLDPTKLVDAISHTVGMPKPVHPKIAERVRMHKLAQKLVDSDEPVSYTPRQGESASEFRKRVQIQRIAATIKERRALPTGKFSDHEPTWSQKRINEALILMRKNLRRAGFRNSKAYRFVSEQWWRNFNRIGGYTSKVEYRKVGDRSHRSEESKLARQLESWK